MVPLNFNCSHCKKNVVASEIFHSNHFKNPLTFWSSLYCNDSFSSTKKLFSMTCLYFFRPVPCLFTKTPSRYAIVCSMKKLMIISWNCHVAIHLGSLSSNLWRFQVCVDEVFSMSNIFVTFDLCLVEGGLLKGLGQ